MDFDVLLPVKLQEKVAPAIDPLLDDKQVWMPAIFHYYSQEALQLLQALYVPSACACFARHSASCFTLGAWCWHELTV